MTQHQANLQDQVKLLATKYQVPNAERLDHSFLKLERLAQFYEDKIPEVPDHQKRQFNGFIAALGYSISLIRMYNNLTTELEKLGGDDDGN